MGYTIFRQTHMMYIDVYEWRYPLSIIIPLKNIVLQHLWGKKLPWKKDLYFTETSGVYG